jgi:hypothetical protein
MVELGLAQNDTMNIMYDQGALQMAHTPIFHSLTKHIKG